MNGSNDATGSVRFYGCISSDGGIAYPDVVQYRLTAGPDAGKILDCPPNVLTHPDPATAQRPPLSSARAAKEAAGFVPAPRASYSYVEVVRDLAAYEILRAEGLLHHPSHTGVPHHVVDNRAVAHHVVDNRAYATRPLTEHEAMAAQDIIAGVIAPAATHGTMIELGSWTRCLEDARRIVKELDDQGFELRKPNT